MAQQSAITKPGSLSRTNSSKEATGDNRWNDRPDTFSAAGTVGSSDGHDDDDEGDEEYGSDEEDSDDDKRRLNTPSSSDVGRSFPDKPLHTRPGRFSLPPNAVMSNLLVDPRVDPLPSPIPPAPSEIDQNDALQLGIYHHEQNNLAVSAHYLSIAARVDHPVGLYLFAMALRHGWGCKVDQAAAVKLFERSANIALTSLPLLEANGRPWSMYGSISGSSFGHDGGVSPLLPPTPPWVDRRGSNGSYTSLFKLPASLSNPSTDDGTPIPELQSMTLGTSSSNRTSLSSYPAGMPARPLSPTRIPGGLQRTPTTSSQVSTPSPRHILNPIIAQNSPLPTTPSTPNSPIFSPLSTPTLDRRNLYQTELALARTFLPLPVYELGMSYSQGWGVPRSKPYALYYFQLAAQLGDPDAQAEIGYAYLRGDGVKRNKYRAARWLREAEKQGKKFVGESWIWKRKYDEGFAGEDGEGPTKKERRKLEKEERRSRKKMKAAGKRESKRHSMKKIEE
ncbi:hypothetical protein HK097_005540 [Rhizophlyctis rosea]|uniref:HCP-like protein n=1 Tax=Rhizophlyctis rosea TaxID=64517 RepID=A0AAD5SJ71_9FUNG|nr:hypothetical protein HK097_005540 [Rhizophlyctis rosea]